MEQKSTSLMKSSLVYGSYLGLISILVSVVIWAGGVIESSGIWGGAIIGLFSLILNFIVLWIFSKSYRNKECGGFINFGTAFKFAFMVIVVATVITTIYNFIFHTIIAPDYMENLMAVMQQNTLEYMENMGAPESAINKAMEKFEDIPTIWKTLRQGILFGIIGGAIIASIVALIVRRKNEDL